MSGQKIIEGMGEACLYARAEVRAIDALTAQLRRLYHHAHHGGTVTAEDIAAMVEIVERFQREARVEAACDPYRRDGGASIPVQSNGVA